MLNAWGFFAVLLLVMWGAGSVRLAATVAFRYLAILDARHALAKHDYERTAEIEASARAEASKRQRLEARTVTDVPADLEAVVLQESEQWARDEMRSQIRDRYIEYGDWNKVRAAIGIGAMDEVPA